MEDLKKYVGEIPDFPKPGVLFRDVAGLFRHPDAFSAAVDRMADAAAGAAPEVLVALESRGFIFAAPIANKLHIPLVLCRKKGKLPGETVEAAYALEYGSAVLAMSKNSLNPGQRTVIIDDLLATGGTAQTAAALTETLGGRVVKLVFFIELLGLAGRKKLAGYDVDCILSYPGA